MAPFVVLKMKIIIEDLTENLKSKSWRCMDQRHRNKQNMNNMHCNLSQLTVYEGKHGSVKCHSQTTHKPTNCWTQVLCTSLPAYVASKSSTTWRNEAITEAALKRNEICLFWVCGELGVISMSLSQWTIVNPSDDDRGEAWLGTGSSSRHAQQREWPPN